MHRWMSREARKAARRVANTLPARHRPAPTHMPARRPHCAAHPACGRPPAASSSRPQALQQPGRSLDVRQQERHLAGRQLLFGPKLRVDEPDRHDAVLLGRVQQPVARPVARRVVLERHLVKPRERVAHVRSVVDGQPPLAARVDVCKGAVGESRAFLRRERRHRLRGRCYGQPPTIARRRPPDRPPTPGGGERRAAGFVERGALGSSKAVDSSIERRASGCPSHAR